MDENLYQYSATKESIKRSEKYMNLALAEAKKGYGKVSPNPLVGAVIVKNDQIIAKGAHLKYGREHAEVNAINKVEVKDDLAGAEMFVTLEPCNHYGKQPPCTESIIKSKIKKVYVASLDPNQKLAGIEKLRAHNIEVVTGVLESKAIELNRPFFKSITEKLPFVTLKSAISLDGSIATDSNDSKWITNEDARTDVHQLRSKQDAILVGANTVFYDNPKLTVRLVEGENPRRIVIDKSLRLASHFKIFSDEFAKKTIIITQRGVNEEKVAAFRQKGITVLEFDLASGKIPIIPLLRAINRLGINSLMIEGGGATSSEFLKIGQVDKVVLYLAPKIIGSNKKFVSGLNISAVKDAILFDEVSYQHFGDNIRFSGLVKK